MGFLKRFFRNVFRDGSVPVGTSSFERLGEEELEAHAPAENAPVDHAAPGGAGPGQRQQREEAEEAAAAQEEVVGHRYSAATAASTERSLLRNVMCPCTGWLFKRSTA